MIPADLASRLRFTSQDQSPSAAQPVTSVQNLGDLLSDLAPGQRILAEIQATMPNGMYRAVVSQREVTLSLPFAAKAGDAIELDVVEHDGKLTLAVVANRNSAATSAKLAESVSTTLSKTGNLIGSLLSEIDQQGGRAKPAQLNANQPLVTTFPDNPADLVPILKESLAKSGMFYEAHQARWVEGKLTTANLLQEPQGKLSVPPNRTLPLTTSTSLRQELPVDQHAFASPSPGGQPVIANTSEIVQSGDTYKVSGQYGKSFANFSAPSQELAQEQLINSDQTPTAGSIENNTHQELGNKSVANQQPATPPPTEQRPGIENTPGQRLSTPPNLQQLTSTPPQEQGQSINDSTTPTATSTEKNTYQELGSKSITGQPPAEQSPAIEPTPAQRPSMGGGTLQQMGSPPPQEQGQRQPINDSATPTTTSGEKNTFQELGSKSVTGHHPMTDNAAVQRLAIDKHSSMEGATLQRMGIDNTNPQRSETAIHPDLTPIVQQQLNALATQNYVWQGQVWPGQSMHWEITEGEHKAKASTDDPAVRWQTRLKLALPRLGGIEATLRIGSGGDLELSLVADSEAVKNTLQAAGQNLGQSFLASGIQLSSFAVIRGEISR